MMRFKPIMLSAVLVVALCGAAQPSDDAGAPAAAPAPADVPVEPAATPPEPAPDTAVLQTPETPPPPAEEAPSSGTGAEAATAPPADAATAADKPAAPAKGQPPTREYFVGVWAEAGKSCDTALDFKADGTLIGPFPRWELSDTGELTMVGNRQKIFLTVLDANTMQSRRAPSDPPRILKRCGG